MGFCHPFFATLTIKRDRFKYSQILVFLKFRYQPIFRLTGVSGYSSHLPRYSHVTLLPTCTIHVTWFLEYAINSDPTQQRFD